jgi:putative oxidoreductase
MFKKLIQTNDDVALLVLRILLGVVFIPHGMQKILGFSGTMQMFTTNLHIPWVFAFLAIMAEFLGSWGLITGLFTRVAAFGIAVNMLVAVYMLHWQNGFFMNWFGNQKGEGYEYHILVVAIALALMIKGGGKWSIDRALTEKVK